ncbi:MAG: tetratricopeptide repeat protein [Armatimonadetes bacterium]|nr:tetratricopeptide repeat protein [Armatimonadota bacterium]
MATKTPVVRPYAWISFPIHLLVIAALVGLAYLILRPDPPRVALIAGAVTYLLYSRGSRTLLTREHLRGMRAVRRGRFTEAIPHFEASYDFFTRHPWIDRWRYVVLLSANAIPYREMALCNIAFCYAQLDDKERTLAYYERALEEFPGSAVARASLQRLRVAESGKKEAAPGKRRAKKG